MQTTISRGFKTSEPCTHPRNPITGELCKWNTWLCYVHSCSTAMHIRVSVECPDGWGIVWSLRELCHTDASQQPCDEIGEGPSPPSAHFLKLETHHSHMHTCKYIYTGTHTDMWDTVVGIHIHVNNIIYNTCNSSIATIMQNIYIYR